MGTNPGAVRVICGATPCGGYWREAHPQGAHPEVGEERTGSPWGRAPLPAESGAEGKES